MLFAHDLKITIRYLKRIIENMQVFVEKPIKYYVKKYYVFGWKDSYNKYISFLLIYKFSVILIKITVSREFPLWLSG